MIEAAANILQLSHEAFFVGFAVFIRVGAMMVVLPLFGEQSIPVRVRIGATLAFTVIVAPTLFDVAQLAPQNIIDFFRVIGPEVVVGLLFGLALRFFVFALQVAGAIAAQSTSLSQIFGGSAGVDPQPAMGRILVVAGLALAALSGLNVQVTLFIMHSYAMVPLGVLISAESVMALGVEEVSKAFAFGFTLSAPFVVASLIYNVTLGVINRAMPQLMVSFVGAPAITAGGLLLMMIVAPVLLSIWLAAFNDFLANPFGPA